MKKLIIIPIAMLTAVVIIAAARVTDNGITENVKGLTVSSQADERTPLYRIRLNDGNVVVYKGNDTVPIYSASNLPIETLPEADLERLSSGINIYTEAELQKLLQDYDINDSIYSYLLK